MLIHRFASNRRAPRKEAQVADNIINKPTRYQTILAACPRCGVLRWNHPSRIHRMCKRCAAHVAATQNPINHRHKHGFSKCSNYVIWLGIRSRCLNPKNRSYRHYGARGITMCERWLNSIEHFNTDMGPRPLGMTIDRIDNDGPYSPENCRWIDRKAQALNTRSNVKITFNGETLTVCQWADKLGLLRETLWSRLFRYRWTIDKAFTTPIHSG